MSFEHTWIGIFVDAAECRRLRPPFAAAAAKAVLSERARQVIAEWRQSPAEFEQDATLSEAGAARVHDLIWAFNLPGFEDLAAECLTADGAFSDLATERHVFRMCIAGRYTPVSIVWHALGPARAHGLPGEMGNLLLSPAEMALAARMTQGAYDGLGERELMQTARRYCSWSVSDDSLGEILSFLPDGLAEAQRRGSGFLALARKQI